MKRQTRSILDEINNLVPNKGRKQVFESRANHIISSAINLLEAISSNFSKEESEDLEKRLLNAIRSRDPQKFVRGIRKISDENK